MSELYPTSEERSARRKRRGTLYLLIIILGMLAFLIFSQQAFNLTFLQPDSIGQTLAFTTLSAIIFLLFVTLTFVLGRTLLKLFAERKLGVLGSAFRTRMVIAGISLSFLPVIALFLFSYALMNRSIDKWFSQPVEDIRRDSHQVVNLLTTYAKDNVRTEAIDIAGNINLQRAFAERDFGSMQDVLSDYEASLLGGFSLVLDGDAVLASHRMSARWDVVRPLLLPLVHSAVVMPQRLNLNGREYLVSSVPLKAKSFVVVVMPLPDSYRDVLNQAENSQKRYQELSASRKDVRRFFMLTLLLITMLVLFAATWLSLFVARLVTRPVSALAEATREVAAGNLQYRVQLNAADEIGELVNSFNRMAEELESTRRQIEASQKDLGDANTALTEVNTTLENRRRAVETLLFNLPTGVLSLDRDRKLQHSNRAFERMFPSSNAQAGTSLLDLFDTSFAADLIHLLRKAERMGSASSAFEVRGTSETLHVDVTVASLQSNREKLGYVLVFEDLSELLHAQKQAAWSEVARRVAHEIKNPLTPIALGAARIGKHLERLQHMEPASLNAIQESVEAISSSVESVRTLVDEFSQLARFPAAKPHSADLNTIVESALALFTGRLDGIVVHTELAQDLPIVMADPDGIKRVVANLVDNAAESLQQQPEEQLREIHISTAVLQERDVVEIIVADTGPGVSGHLKEKLFLPYFSTKERGTGLGLAIVRRILEEHHGTIRVEKNYPCGAKFIIELPITPVESNV